MRELSLVTKIVPSEVRAHRFIELDSLRGIAAWVVAFGHFTMLWNSTAWYGWINRSPMRIVFAGHEAVILFFVLSGFVLSIPMSGNHPPRYGAFLLKRFCRLYLPYAAGVVLATTGCLFLHGTISTRNPILNQVWASKPTLGLVAGHLLTTTQSLSALNPILWTLVVEIRVSILFPLLFWVVRRVRPAALLGAIAVLSGGLPLVPHGISFMARVISPTYIALFAMGILLWHHLPAVSQFLGRISGRGRVGALLLSLVCLLGPLALDAWLERPIPFSIYQLADIVSGAGAAGLLACAIQPGGFRHFLHGPVLVRLGALSYSTYLMHPIVLFLLIHLFYGRFPFYYLLPVYLGGAYLVSELFHKFVDQPSVALGRRVGKRRQLGERAQT